MYKEFLGNQGGNIFLVAGKDHEFLLSHSGTALYASLSSVESRKSNHNYVKKSSSSSTTHTQVSFLDLVTIYTQPTI